MKIRDQHLVSVVICSYNGAHRLPDVLGSLAKQISEVRWELIVVDNNSIDNTSAVAESYGNLIGCDLRVVKEMRQGLVYARQRGYVESKGAVLSFLDDDTLVSENWVAECYKFFMEHPKAGLAGPKILPMLDVSPPPYFKHIQAYFGITSMGEEVLNCSDLAIGHPLCPHGSCRADAVDGFFAKDSFKIIGRNGSALSSCEDSALAYYVRNSGWEWWYNPNLTMLHHLETYRLDANYLKRLATGMGQSAAELAELKGDLSATFLANLSRAVICLAQSLKYMLGYVFSCNANMRLARHLTAIRYYSSFSSHLKSASAIIKRHSRSDI